MTSNIHLSMMDQKKTNHSKLQEINRHEVLLHNTPEDCWVILFNKVYDLSEFISSHPGGSHIFITRAGEDCSSYFLARHGYNQHHLKHLEQFKIGELPLAERIPEEDLKEDFVQELVELCQKKNLFSVDLGKKRKFFFMRLIMVLVFFASSYFVLFSSVHIGISISLVIIQSIIGASLFGFIAHEHTHRDFPKGKVGKFFLRIAWPIFWPFISQKPLVYEHNSHHIKIGDPSHDFEVIGFSHFIKYSSKVKHRKIHRYQHKIAFLLYFFYANIITTAGGGFSKFWSSHNRKVVWEHTISVLFTFAYFVFLPFMISHASLSYLLLHYLLYQCVLFFIIYVGAAINHFTPGAMNKIPSELANKYGYYICANTANFAVGSSWWFWLTGGFNIQIEHHLIPFVPVENLRELVPIVKDLCQKYNYPYYDYTTFKALWDDHYAYLAILANDESQNLLLNEVRNKNAYQAR